MASVCPATVARQAAAGRPTSVSRGLRAGRASTTRTAPQACARRTCAHERWCAHLLRGASKTDDFPPFVGLAVLLVGFWVLAGFAVLAGFWVLAGFCVWSGASFQGMGAGPGLAAAAAVSIGSALGGGASVVLAVDSVRGV